MLSTLRVLGPASPLDIASGGCLPARNNLCLYPDSNLDYKESLRLAGKYATRKVITSHNLGNSSDFLGLG